ncbi:MAG: hypothetical protein Kow0031_26610 [Anaerolineae bacterium]
MSGQPIPPRTQSDEYRLFILRMWQDTPDGPTRYMLKAADDSRRHVFADAHSLAKFLENTTLDVKEEI